VILVQRLIFRDADEKLNKAEIILSVIIPILKVNREKDSFFGVSPGA
jgi:hypothetical protein